MSARRVFSDDVIEQRLTSDEVYLFRMAQHFKRTGTGNEKILSENIIAILDRLAAARYVREVAARPATAEGTV